LAKINQLSVKSNKQQPRVKAASMRNWKLPYGRVCVGKHLSDMFPIKNGFKQGDALPPLFFNFALGYAI